MMFKTYRKCCLGVVIKSAINCLELMLMQLETVKIAMHMSC